MSTVAPSSKADTRPMTDHAMRRIVESKSNPLSDEDRTSLRELYIQVRSDIKSAIASQDMDDLDFAFWLDVLSIGMTVAEHLGDEGTKKRYLVIEVVALVLEEELPVDEDDRKATIVESFRKFAPKAIDIIVFMSKQLNIKTFFEKCCPCF